MRRISGNRISRIQPVMKMKQKQNKTLRQMVIHPLQRF